MLDFSQSPLIMGILNYTTDSFSDGGRYNNPSEAINHAVDMVNCGADIVDFGACSTRPGSDFIPEKNERSILKEMIPLLKNIISVPLSVDTFYVNNQILSIELGADIINDVSGIYSKETAYAVKNSNVYWVIMHGGVKSSPDIDNTIFSSVQNFFDEIYEQVCEDKIADKIILDPGFGFNKDTEQNRILLSSLDKLNTHGIPLLCALSRKRFIGQLSGETDSVCRIGGSIVGNIVAAQKGASIIRVHDVFNHKKAITFLQNI